MAQDMHKVIDRLNDLIALDIDAVNAYEEAIQRMSANSIRDRLREFQGDHQRHVRDLSAAVTRFGGQPRQKPDIKGFVIKGFTAVTSSMGDEAALKAMKGNEQLTTKTYAKALQDDWSGDLRDLVQRNYADEQRHLAYVEQCLQNRLWEQGAEAHP